MDTSDENMDDKNSLRKPSCKSNSSDETKNIRTLLEEFRDETSMHGVRHAGLASRRRKRGIVWALVFTAMVSAVVISMWTMYTKYTEYRTTSDIKIQRKTTLPFPAVTLCSLSPYDKSRMNMTSEMRNILVKKSALFMLSEPVSNWNDSFYTQQPAEGDIYKHSFLQNSLIKICSFEHRLCGENAIKPVKTDLGICFSFNQDANFTTSFTGSEYGLMLVLVTPQANYVMGRYLSAGFKVVLHEPDKVPDMENEGFMVSPGFTTYASIKTTKYTYQSHPYQAFENTYCQKTDSDDFTNPLKYYESYSHYACLKECKVNYLSEKCGCRLATDKGSAGICSIEKEIKCYLPETVTFSSNSQLQEACKCVHPCKATTFETQISTSYFPNDETADFLGPLMNETDFRKNYAELRIYYSSLSYIMVEQVPEYSWNALAGSIGGQLGLYIGTSILTICEVVELLFLVMEVLLKRLYYFIKRTLPKNSLVPKK